jgi:tripartite-type tricarboxylate transporter receptor subunit TctC
MTQRLRKRRLCKWRALSFAIAGSLCALVLATPSARADDYPSKPIKIIVPNPPGGAGDITARLVAKNLTDVMHQPVVVENVPGAAGSIGVNQLKRADPDGYTIGVVLSLSQTIDLIQQKKATFDIAKDFTPITGIANNPAGLLVNSEIPSKTMADFIALVKSKPGVYSYGSAGIGTAHYMYGEVLNKIAGIKMVNVPYKGVAPAFNDLLGGHIPIAIVSLATAAPHLSGGKVRLLTVFDTKRYAKAPDVPTITEVVPKYVPARAWIGFLAPPKTPDAIADRLNTEIVRILKSPDVDAVLAKIGLEPIANSRSDFKEMIAQDARIWDEAAVLAGVVPPPDQR